MTFTDWSVQSVNLYIALKAMFYLLNNSFERNTHNSGTTQQGLTKIQCISTLHRAHEFHQDDLKTVVGA